MIGVLISTIFPLVIGFEASQNVERCSSLLCGFFTFIE